MTQKDTATEEKKKENRNQARRERAKAKREEKKLAEENKKLMAGIPVAPTLSEDDILVFLVETGEQVKKCYGALENISVRGLSDMQRVSGVMTTLDEMALNLAKIIELKAEDLQRVSDAIQDAQVAARKAQKEAEVGE